MSARFGRNKRRRAREQIAALQELQAKTSLGFESARALSQLLSQNLEQLRDEMRRAIQIAGNMSILFPATQIKVDRPPMDTWDIHKFPAFDPRTAIGPAAAVTVQRLSVMLSRIDADHLSRAVHVGVQFRGMHYGYAVSEEAVQSAPNEVLAERIADQVTRMIVDDLKKSKP